jgi:hypothetical protein
MHIGFRWGGQKERDHWEDLEVGGRIILEWILEREDVVEWIGLISLSEGFL